MIAKALDKVLSERTVRGKASEEACGERMPVYEVVDETRTPLPQLIHQYIDSGMPVVCWACINMREPVIGPEWRLMDTGEVFTWVSNEHCMLLVGYDVKGYYFNDPYEGNELIHYPKAIVEERHCAQHMQAVAVVRKDGERKN